MMFSPELQKISDRIATKIASSPYLDTSILAFLNSLRNDLDILIDRGLEYKEILDAIDFSIYITDGDGKTIYVNPAYRRNTGIKPEEVIGRYVSDIVQEGKLFTGGATLDVLKTGKRVFKLSTVYKTGKPEVGYTVGVPMFDDHGKIFRVVVSSRPLRTLTGLRDDYDKFLNQLNAIDAQKNNAIVVKSGTAAHTKSSKLVGVSAHRNDILDTIRKAAPTDATIMITGESGVGKEVVADDIVSKSSRVNKTFVKVNCAAIPTTLLESELFGYEPGAFSGAKASGKQGLFEMADGGTLFLDEIGDMPAELQVKLLRAIQNNEITRVGGTKPIRLNIRYIAATNQDLKKKVRAGEFRQDLYYRLNVIPIYIPPLRERMDDIDSLADHFVDVYTKKHNKKFVLSHAVRSIIKNYSWPGNIRELENVIEFMTICASGNDSIDQEMLFNLLDLDNVASDAAGVISTVNRSTPSENHHAPLSDTIADYEKRVIEQTLAISTSLRDAGAKLGINASTLSRKIKRYGINYPASRK